MASPTDAGSPALRGGGSIRRSLTWRVAALVAGALVAFSLAMQGFVLGPWVARQAETNLATAGALARNRMSTLFHQVESDLRVGRARGLAGQFSLDNLRSFNDWFQPYLTHSQPVSSALYADEAGREFLLLGLADGTWMNRLTDPKSAPGSIRRIRRDTSSTVIGDAVEPSDYDPRKRPWFQGAMAKDLGDRVHWTQPYRFFTTQEPGITASVRWRSSDGRTQVLAFDVLLKDLSLTARSVHVSANGFATLLTGDGRVLAPPLHPALPEDGISSLLLAPVARLGISPISKAMAAFHDVADQPVVNVAFESEGRDWVGRIERYPLHPGHALIATIAPSSDFAPPRSLLLAALATTGLVFALAGAAFAHRLAQRFVEPLDRLAEQSEKIGALDFSEGPVVESPWKEVRRLARDQDRMRELLASATRELEEANRHLEERVSARTRALEAANADLASFSYAVSHDLRAPLRAINGHSAILEEEQKSRLDASAMRNLAKVREASQHMSELIDSLLLLARLSTHKLARVPVDLSAAARDIVAALEETDASRKVRWHVADGCVTVGDTALLRSVMQNLLSNAWKFTAAVPDAEITFDCAGRAAETVFRVTDNGAGFNPDDAAHLFEPFQRAHKDAEFPGTGIGLAVVRRILEQHGGRIWAESRIGHGATFKFKVGESAPGA